jgi:predicted Zn-dependent protease
VQYEEEKVSAIRTLLTQHPDDLFVQRAYIQAMSEPSDRDRVIEEYKTRYEHAPGSPQLSYLYGLALFGRRTPDAIKLFDGAPSRRCPTFPGRILRW